MKMKVLSQNIEWIIEKETLKNILKADSVFSSSSHNLRSFIINHNSKLIIDQIWERRNSISKIGLE